MKLFKKYSMNKAELTKELLRVLEGQKEYK